MRLLIKNLNKQTLSINRILAIYQKNLISMLGTNEFSGDVQEVLEKILNSSRPITPGMVKMCLKYVHGYFKDEFEDICFRIIKIQEFGLRMAQIHAGLNEIIIYLKATKDTQTAQTMFVAMQIEDLQPKVLELKNMCGVNF